MQRQDKAGFFPALASFLIPLVGLILFFSWKRDRPQAAKTCLIAAIISIVVYIIVIVILVVAAASVIDIAEQIDSAMSDLDELAFRR